MEKVIGVKVWNRVIYDNNCVCNVVFVFFKFGDEIDEGNCCFFVFV